MSRNIGLFSGENKKISWWWLGIKVGVVAGLIVWWWLDNRKKQFMKETASKAPGDKIQSIPLPMESDLPDDLTVIEGIGPKINHSLQEAGIHTFVQLAVSDLRLSSKSFLKPAFESDLPDTWPEQAVLAAKADWIALKALQSGLKGGRRVDS